MDDMRIVELPEILAALDEQAALAAVEDGFRRLHRGGVQLAEVAHLNFENPPGDCHVKGGYITGDDVFVFKFATSFYRNPELGLSSSNGCMIVVSARTGEHLAMLKDQGVLTDKRTAMAGALAARAIMRPGSRVLGVVGTGIQAKTQGEMTARLLGLDEILVYGRSADKAAGLATELGGKAVDLAELCARADLIVTTTPTTSPVLTADLVRPGTRVVAVGADTPGKQELETALTAKARLIVDSAVQCAHHGEAGWPIRAGLIAPDSLVELGALLENPVDFSGDDIVVADLTGVAVQDTAIAKTVWERLST
jgi:ornithine cyclodeaminase